MELDLIKINKQIEEHIDKMIEQEEFMPDAYHTLKDLKKMRKAELLKIYNIEALINGIKQH